MTNYSPNSYPQPTTKRRVDSGGPDFYPTPRWATQALVDYEFFEGLTSEPACGDGEMAIVLIEVGLNITASDLYARNYGRTGVDFLKTTIVFDNIITNPPYNIAEEFLLHALSLTKKKVALLLRLAFLESSRRQRNIFQEFPPSRIWVFSERVTFYPKGEERASGGTTAYAWFVWDHADLDNELARQNIPQVKWIPLGRKPNSRKAFKSTIGAKLTLSDLLP